MARAIQVGVIGANPTSGWALPTHLPALSTLDEFDLVAVATSRIESAAAAAELFGANKAYADGHELIDDDDVELVVVSVRIPDHYRYVMAAIERGKHVFCEWPLGRDLQEAVELATAADERGVVHAVGLQGRKSPTVNYVRDLIEGGFIGEVLSADLALIVAGPGSREFTVNQRWTADRSNGFTTLSILGAHNLDIVRYILGDFTEFQATEAVRSPVGRVVETGEQIAVSMPDVTMIEGRLASGAFASATVQAGLSHGHGVRLEIFGSEGVLILTDPLTLNFGDGNVRLVGAQKGEAPSPIAVPARYRNVPDAVPDTWARNVAGLYLAMAGAIDGSTPPPEPNFDTAVDLHSFIAAVQVASETGVRQVIAG